MFTTGSKFFLGATAVGLVGTVAFGVTKTGDSLFLGTIALVGALLALLILTAINFFTRDGNTPSMEPGVTRTAAAAQRSAGRSIAPVLAAIGVGTLAVGAETRPVVFKLGVILLLAAAAEWLVRAWSERASADQHFNQAVSSRLLQPFQFPIVATAGLGAVIYSFSRILLWMNKDGGPAVFGIVGALVLLGGYLLMSKPNLKKGLASGVLAIAALGLVSTGAVMAVDGQREIDKHPTTAMEPEVCEEAEANDEVDKRAPQAVMAEASVAGYVVVKDGKLFAHLQGQGDALSTITLSKGNATNIIFKNEDKESRRFTVHLGTFTEKINDTNVKKKPVDCTTLMKPDSEVLKTLKFAKASAASESPYTISVAGLEGQEITVMVP